MDTSVAQPLDHWISSRHAAPDGRASRNRGGLSTQDLAQARVARARWFPDASDPTPLIALPGLSRSLGLGSVHVKDEGARFGFGGVKALGAPYALARALERRGQGSVTALAATDGNHGLALAWAGQRLACPVRIFMGQGADPHRAARIRGQGAEVVIVDGTYDDAVAAAEQAAAEDPQAVLITDTDYLGDCVETRDIMAGYAVAGWELARQWPGSGSGDLAVPTTPTHVFLQCGVGGMAASVLMGWQDAMPPDTALPVIVLVEPARAAAVLISLRAGHSRSVPGSLDTIMAGLACGRPSLPAFDWLVSHATAAISVQDADVFPTMALLAEGVAGDTAIHAGDTGIAGVLGLRAACADPMLRAQLGLNASAHVALICTEGPVPVPQEKKI